MKQIFKISFIILLVFNIFIKSASKTTKNPESINKITVDEIKNVSEKPSFLKYRAQYAEKMLSFMNQSVDPCDDFYEYACGNYKNVYVKRQPQPFPPSRQADLEYDLIDLVEELLLKPDKYLGVEYAAELEMVQKFYNSCLSADLYPMKKSQTYLELLRSIGGFPAADHTWQVTADNFSWFNMSAHLNNFGASGLIREKFNTQSYALYFAAPELGFDYKIKKNLTNAIETGANDVNENRMRQLLTTYQSDKANSTQVIADIMELWQSILNITEPEFTEVPDDCQIQWNVYSEIAWNGRDMHLEDDEYCVYLKNLNAICEQRKEAVANYLSLQFLHHMQARLDDGKFQKEMCLIKLRTGIPYLFDKLYLTKHFDVEILDEVNTILMELRKSLITLLKASDFLDEKTRKEALLKVSAIVTRINYNQKLELKERVLRELNKFAFVDDNFERNNMELMKYKSVLKRYYTLHSNELTDKTLPLEDLISMNAQAMYSVLENAINISPGILNPPVYHKAWPYSLKFAALGNLMGHELTHAFDSFGAHFDSNGDYNNWWTEELYDAFNTSAKCFIEHFSSYVIPAINRTINGVSTKDENIADSGGLRESLNAYRSYIKALSAVGNISLPLDEQMPGMNLSPEQLYFLGFAQVWCAAYEEEHYWSALDRVHTINKYRVLGAMTNSDEFPKVYNCPLGSRMNPKTEKCRLW